MGNFGILTHTRYRQYKQALSNVKTPNGTKMSTEKSTEEEDWRQNLWSRSLENNHEKFQYNTHSEQSPMCITFSKITLYRIGVKDIESNGPFKVSRFYSEEEDKR